MVKIKNLMENVRDASARLDILNLIQNVKKMISVLTEGYFIMVYAKFLLKWKNHVRMKTRFLIKQPKVAIVL